MRRGTFTIIGGGDVKWKAAGKQILLRIPLRVTSDFRFLLGYVHLLPKGSLLSGSLATILVL